MIKNIEFMATRLLKHAPWAYGLARTVMTIFDNASVRLSEVRGRTPLIVYQQGRVGSTAVYEALVHADLGLPVHHLHTISTTTARRIRADARAQSRTVPRNIVLADIVGRSLERRVQGSAPLPVAHFVNIFRDPLAVCVSLHLMHARADTIGVRPEVFARRIAADVIGRIEVGDPAGWHITRWMETVLATELGVDVYAAPFDHARGFTLMRSDHHRIVLIKYERLGEVLRDAVGSLLERDLPQLRLVHANPHHNLALRAQEGEVRRHLRFSEPFCLRLTQTRFMQHFYSDDERAGLVARWTGAAL